MFEILPMQMQDFEKIKNNLIEDFDDFWKPSVLETELSSPNRRYMMLKNSNEIAAFIGILINANEMEIMNIVVKKLERKKGYASQLLNETIEFARENNFARILLEVNANNISAIKLYEKFGFKQNGIRKGYYNGSDDAILYELKL